MADAVVLIICNSTKNVLLQLRDERARVYPNCWSFFGGAIEPGEAPEIAVAREALEELEYKVKDPVLFTTLRKKDDGTKYFFVEEFDSSQTPHLREGKDARWFSLDAALELPFPPHHRAALHQLISKGSHPFLLQ